MVDHTFTSSASHACGNYASDDVFTSFVADIPSQVLELVLGPACMFNITSTLNYPLKVWKGLGGVECVYLNEISAEIQIPKKLGNFWTSPANKTNLQQRGLSLASSTPVFAQQDVLLSGSVTDEGIVPAQFLCVDGLSVPPSIKTSEVNTLVCNVKEAYVMV